MKLVVVVQKAVHIIAFELVATLQEVELDREGDARNDAAELLDKLHGCLHRAAGGEQIVDEQDTLAGLDRVEVDFERVRTVLEVVADLRCFSRKLLGLRTGTKPAFKRYAMAGAKMKPRASVPRTTSMSLPM